MGWQQRGVRKSQFDIAHVHSIYRLLPVFSQICVKPRFCLFSQQLGFVSSVHQNAALQHLFIRKCFRPFKCTHCGKAFRDKDKLDQHLRVHGRDAYSLSCHICSKSFISDSALEDHLLVHTDSRSYSCILCPETFEKLEMLKDHVGVHAVDGCFGCPICKKTFTDFMQVSNVAVNGMERSSSSISVLNRAFVFW